MIIGMIIGGGGLTIEHTPQRLGWSSHSHPLNIAVAKAHPDVPSAEVNNLCPKWDRGAFYVVTETSQMQVDV